MKIRPLSHLSDQELLLSLKRAVAHERARTAERLAHLAEYDARRLYLARGCSSMEEYCLKKGMDEDEVPMLIVAARTARLFPAIFPAVAEGRLHVEAVVLLAPHFTPDNADELIAAATHRTESEIEQLVAERFPGSAQGRPATG